MMRWVTGPIVAVMVLAAAACSGSGAGGRPGPPTPPTMVRDLDAAVQHASSVHVEGTAPDGGQQVRVDLSMNRSGGLSGQVTANGSTVQVLSTRGVTYIKVTGSFLANVHLPASACAVVCGKYLTVSAAQVGLVSGLRMPAFMAALTKGSPHFQYAGTATVNGQRTWVFRSRTSGRAYVAARGPAYPLRAVAPPGKSGQLDFTQWNHATIPPPPPASQVVNPSQLQG